MAGYIISAIASVFCGVLTFVGVILTINSNNKKVIAALDTKQQLTELKIDNLAKKVDKHNNVVERTYQLEQDIALCKEKLAVANHRIADLEKVATNEKN